MSYHALSLLQHDYKVNIIGYLENEPISEIASNPNVNFEALMPPPSLAIPNILMYLWKTVWVSFTLWWALFRCLILQKSNILICQNPPAVPALIVCYFMCMFGRTRLIVDYHNYTFSILQLTNQPDNILVKIAKIIETTVGRLSYANFCVTKAMKEDLEKTYKVKATVLYDRPPSHFKTISLKEKHDLIMKLAATYPELKIDDKTTPFTEMNENGVVVNKTSNRAALLVSSTSWTPDEDFSILLAALESKIYFNWNSNE